MAESSSSSSQEISNPRGIPTAPFVEDVEAFVDSRADIEPNLKKFQEMIAFVFSLPSFGLLLLVYPRLTVGGGGGRRAAGLKDKIPDIQKTLDTVTFLESRSDSSKEIDATFELNDTLYAKAKINPTDEVYLWLGANVMLSYPVDEAKKLLTGKLTAAKESLGNCEEDLDFLRQQITTLEVNTARLYNYEVTLKRKEKEEAGEAAGEDK
ncbi:uncharacterized protein H6S33_013038 [Morchella sextelata]|uniref:uncharacterized protein n=1 Tax=Morchella sextelata TaxID=1174677 RepID=UPI001D05111F|nr:uncharacterized protein H6S33_013038 [Morchella sextelata]KAH0609552.1 hypothetical protein H6S33_013038 [Morchella sextelata]